MRKIKEREFKLEIGTIINDNGRNLIIIDRELRPINRKGKNRRKDYIEMKRFYKYHCNTCNNEDWIVQEHLLGQNAKRGCNSCGKIPKKVTEYNCLATKRPDLLIYLYNEEDGFKYTSCSKTKVKCKCPICGNIKNVTIVNLSKQGFGCGVCSDGFSFPEKIMYLLLKQLDLDFETQYSPKYLKNKRSDFYLPDYNLVIEVDGALGHEGGRVHPKSNKTLDELIEVDKWKDEQHLKHGIKTIRINCFESDLEYIKNNILNSKLSQIFNLSNIDWNKCEEFALSNLMKEVWNIKKNNPEMSTLEIAESVGLNRTTVIFYLNRGSELGLCEYNGQEEMIKSALNNAKEKCKKIEVFKDGISLGIFESGVELEKNSEKMFGVRFARSSIYQVCRGLKDIYKEVYSFKYV